MVSRSWELPTDYVTSQELRHFSDKWVVIDAVTSPCTNLTLTPMSTEWNVVIVTDQELNLTDCRPTRCVQLTQANFRSHLGQLMTSSMFSRPNQVLGYLMAISLGATSILDAACSTPHHLLADPSRLVQQQPVGLWYNRTALFDPYQYSGLAHPLPFDVDGPSTTAASAELEIFHIRDLVTLTIEQTILSPNGDCKTNDQTPESLPAKLPVVVASETIAPLTTGPTLFTQDAFMWMLQFPDMPEWHSLLFRTLWLHAIRQFFPVYIGYTASQVGTCSTSSPAPGSVNITDVISCVNQATCSNRNWIAECSIALARHVLSCIGEDNSDLFIKNKNILVSWVDDLDILGYKFTREAFTKPKPNLTESFPVYLGSNFRPGEATNTPAQTWGDDSIQTFMSTYCGRGENQSRSAVSNWAHPVISDMVLVVVLENTDSLLTQEQLSQVLPYLQYLHRQYFRHIVYCGGSLPDDVILSLGLDHVTYIAGLSSGPSSSYQCVSHVIRLGMRVKGYLHVTADTLVNSWNLADLPRDMIWMPRGASKINIYKTKHLKHWLHWNDKSQRSAMLKVFAELQNTYADTTEPDDRHHAFAVKFLDNYSSNLGLNFVLYRAANIFYIPEVLKDEYLMASDLFLRHHAFREMAVPAIHFGIAKNNSVIYITGSHLYNENQNHPWNYFSAEHSYFLRPFSPVKHFQSMQGLDFFCNNYLKFYEGAIQSLRHRST